MNARTSILGVAAGLLALGLGAASAQTAGHGHGFGAAVKGTVQNLGSSSFQVKSSTGTLTTVSFNAQTRVEKVIAGTTADLTKNAHVTLKLQSGTTTVTAIQIEPTVTKPASGTNTGTPRVHPVHSHPTKGTKTGKPTGTTKKPTTSVAHTVAGGAVASLSGNTLTLTGRGGTTATYTLASNVKITKIVTGTTGDLTNGETVQLFAPTTGAAREITILA
jgi:hypothetical protein